MKPLTRSQAKRRFAALLKKKLDEGMRDLARTRKAMIPRPATKRRLKQLERQLLKLKENER